MRFVRASILMLMTAFIGNAAAQSIFNVQPVQSQGVQQQKLAPVPASSVTPVVTAPSIGQQVSSPLVDPKVMAQFDQLPNESNDAYLTRLKALSQKSVADMERTLREHNAKMKALAPK